MAAHGSLLVVGVLVGYPHGAPCQDVRVNQVLLYDQDPVGVATDGATFRAAYYDISDTICPTWSILMRQASPAGTFLTPEKLGQGTCTPSENFQQGDIAMLPSGTFLVIRAGSQFNDIIGQVFDTGGNLVGGETTIHGAGSAVLMSLNVVAHPAGRFLVQWTLGPGDVYGRFVLSDGSLGSPEVLLSQDPGKEINGRVAVFSSGEVVGVWEHVTSLWMGDVVERRFDEWLSPLGAESAVSQTSVYLVGPIVGVAARGTEYVVAWVDGKPDSDVYARRMSQVTGAVGNPFRVNDYTLDTQGAPTCSIDSQERTVIVWISYGQDGSSNGVFGRRLDSQGNRIGNEFQVNMRTWAQQGPGGVAMTAAGDFIVLFGSVADASGNGDTFMRRFFFPVSLVLGPGPGGTNSPWVVTRRPDGGATGGASFNAYGAGGYGATVGTGDVDADGFSEVLTGPGPSPVYGPQVRAFRRDGTSINKINYWAYGTLRYGVKESGANVDGDAYGEILTTPGPGSVFGPHVRGWNYDNATLLPIQKISVFAYGTLKYGANASCGNVDGDAYGEILTGPGPGPVFGSQIRGFNYDNTAIAPMGKVNFYAFALPAAYGAMMTASDVESDGEGGYGDGFDEIVAGRGPDPQAGADFDIFDYDNAFIAQKYAVAPAFVGTKLGVNVAGGDVDAGDTQEIATAPGPDPAVPARVLCWEWKPVIGYDPDGANLQTIGTDDFVEYQGPPQLLYGCNVAIGKLE